MPIIDGKEVSPEDAIKQGRCPETGVDLEGVNIEDHIARLWPRNRSEDALKRIDMLRQFDTERKVPEGEDRPSKRK